MTGRTMKQRVADLEGQLDLAMVNLSRIAQESHSYKRAFRRAYERQRRLESAVRGAVKVGEPVDPEALLRLRRMVPDTPRPTLRELQRRIHEKTSSATALRAGRETGGS